MLMLVSAARERRDDWKQLLNSPLLAPSVCPRLVGSLAASPSSPVASVASALWCSFHTMSYHALEIDEERTVRPSPCNGGTHLGAGDRSRASLCSNRMRASACCCSALCSSRLTWRDEGEEVRGWW